MGFPGNSSIGVESKVCSGLNSVGSGMWGVGLAKSGVGTSINHSSVFSTGFALSGEVLASIGGVE